MANMMFSCLKQIISHEKNNFMIVNKIRTLSLEHFISRCLKYLQSPGLVLTLSVPGFNSSFSHQTGKFGQIFTKLSAYDAIGLPKLIITICGHACARCMHSTYIHACIFFCCEYYLQN